MKRLTAIFLIAVLLCGCGSTQPENLAQEVPERVVCLAEKPNCAVQATDFALRLLQKSQKEGENALVSPLSVLAALGMTANGADGETLSQMEEALGMAPEELNAYIYSYMQSQTDQLKLANAIWLKDSDRLTVEESFLQSNADYYKADIFRAVFDDAALTQINGWVESRTDGMIPKILDRMDSHAVMYLVNALAFEAEWEESYEVHQVRDGIFTTEAGDEQEIKLMASTESWYLEDENATGFLKYYKDRHYAFAVLLPREGISVSEYAASLTGGQLQKILKNPTEAVVRAALPKFQTEFEAELSDALKSMGMTDAFEESKADFSRLGHSKDGNLYISRVLHKTAITVAEEGTRAAAATAVEMLAGAAFNPDIKFVTLDRPFVYMLIDCEENLPFFIGTLMDMGEDACSLPTAPAEEADVPSLSTPPKLTAAFDGQELTLEPGNYEWNISSRGNSMQTIIACGAVPLDYAEKEPMVVTAGESIRLVWLAENQDGTVGEATPDSVSAAGWDAATGESVPLALDGDTLSLSGGYGIYEITAEWEGRGTASYVLTVSKP